MIYVCSFILNFFLMNLQFHNKIIVELQPKLQMSTISSAILDIVVLNHQSCCHGPWTRWRTGGIEYHETKTTTTTNESRVMFVRTCNGKIIYIYVIHM